MDGPPVNVVRETAGQQFVQHDAQRVDIGPDVEVIHHPVELLGAHVLQRAHDASVASQHRGERRVLLHASGDTEVDDLRLAGRAHQNIARLQVAVDDSLVMAVGDRETGLPEEADAITSGEGVLAGEGGDRQGIVDVFHHEVRDRAAGHGLRPDVVDLGDTGMSQAAEDLRLILEPLHGLGRQRARADDFHGDRAAGYPLERLVHPPHAPFAEQADDRLVTESRAGEERVVTRDRPVEERRQAIETQPRVIRVVVRGRGVGFKFRHGMPITDDWLPPLSG